MKVNEQKILFAATKIRQVLSVVALGLSGFLICAPFFPQVQYYADEAVENTVKDNKTLSQIIPPKAQKKDPENNTLRIKKIDVESGIIEGNTEEALLQGMWLRPNGSNPEKGGNTIITGHRFLYTSGQNTLYHLDKLTIGDEISVFWNTKEFKYSVAETKIVPPTATEIENPTQETQLTIYTCTPVWTATDRLVIIAKPI
jgi:LPXTG-site transpeptidase (sortase) family protein